MIRNDINFVCRYVTIAANSSEAIDEIGSFFMIIENNSATEVEVSFDKSHFSPMPASFPFDAKGNYFSRVTLKNTSVSPMTVRYIISNGVVSSGHLVSLGILEVDFASNTIETPDAIVVAVAAPATLIAGADSTRKELIIENTGNYTVWVGASNVDPAIKRGKSIEVGDSIIYTTNAAMYARSETAAGQVSITILKKV